MSAAVIVAALQQAGIVVEAVAGQVRLYNPNGRVPADVVDAARRHKPEILHLLARGETPRAWREGDTAPGADADVAQAGAEQPADRRVQLEHNGDAAPAGDDATAWRAWMRSRVHDRRRLDWPRAVAVATAWGEAECLWHARHGARPERYRCAGCQALLVGQAAMALSDGAWIHWDHEHGLDCLITYGRRWRGAAAAGLAALGLQAPVIAGEGQ